MKKCQLTDAQLIQKYLKGCDKSFAELVHRHKAKVFSSIYLMMRDRELAEDLTQEVFIKFVDILNKGNYYDEGKFKAWILRVAHNMCIDYIRKSGRIQISRMPENYETISLSHMQQEASVEVLAIQEEGRSTLRTMIKNLPFEQRQVVLMRHYADMSFKEIADLTGVSINTALGRMRYAVNNLRKQLEVNKLAYDETLYPN
ncbi:MAG TPA: sigma-70 family RNA polymerase sigma factor [Cytophagales bacterium]|nr:sigma-70 family RNA polymerase sigma factor [Cytophagales bacterium]